ncbi:MAG: signal peptide peptidase SppA [Candidatus Cloacimonetes bacterium]|nr:signal peptide peptidase SppA [Candidatus Cloacimonadota bacterium]
MKKTLIPLLLILTSTCFAIDGLHYFSVAEQDGLLAARVNPAALAFGNAAGFGLFWDYNKDFKFNKSDYGLIINTKYLGYDYSHTESADLHAVYLASALIRNLYWGTRLDWVNSGIKKGDFMHSVLYRPADFLSLGGTGYRIWGDNPSYRLGVAFRPFMGTGFSDRITLFSDFSYSDDEWLKPVAGLQTELVDGFHIGGGYDLEGKTLGINFSLDLDKFQLGNFTTTDTDHEITGGTMYLHCSANTYRSVFQQDGNNDYYSMKLSGKILEKKPAFEIGPFSLISKKDRTLAEIIAEIKKLQEDKRIEGILFKNADFKASFAQMMELRQALLDFKSSGRKVIFYYDQVGNMNYVLAAAVADEIYLHPQGEVLLRGISVSLPYLRNLLDTLGISVVNFRSHNYKTAGNIFSEDEMTPAEEESYEYILEGFYKEMISLIEQGRGDRLHQDVADLIDAGPYLLSEKALEAGLIDAIAYEDELEELLGNSLGKASIWKEVDEHLIRYDWSDKKKDKIAVIYAIGDIHEGESKPGKSIGAVTTGNAIREAREDSSIKGIIFRVDSGGGSALASDIIAREIELCHYGENRKPVIVSMSGVAGSGGYYIAVNADEIIAQPTTITGSIGVIAIFPNLRRMYDKILVNWSTIKKGLHADITSTTRDMTEEEEELLSEAIHYIYDDFVNKVARARHMTWEEVHQVAQGRIWTGKQAQERGLIDLLGGMQLACEEMTRLADLKHEIELVEFDGQQKKPVTITLSYQNQLADMLGIPLDLLQTGNLIQRLKNYQNERILMVLPYDLEIE